MNKRSPWRRQAAVVMDGVQREDEEEISLSLQISFFPPFSSLLFVTSPVAFSFFMSSFSNFLLFLHLILSFASCLLFCSFLSFSYLLSRFLFSPLRSSRFASCICSFYLILFLSHYILCIRFPSCPVTPPCWFCFFFCFSSSCFVSSFSISSLLAVEIILICFRVCV